MTSTTTASLAGQLAQLYAQARYFARIGQQQFQLHIGALAPDLEQHLSAASYLYITAWNPHSQPVSDQQNAAADQALRQRLMDAGLSSYPACSSDTDGGALEHGWLVLNLSQDQADHLARAFGQAGIVYWHAGHPVRLRMQLARPEHWITDTNIQWIG